MPHRLKSGLLCAVLLAPFAASALPLLRPGERADALHLDARAEASATGENLRPTGPSGPYGMNYGASSPLQLDAGPGARIWYVVDGPHAVPPEDLDGSGVPDFVEMLAAQVLEITARFEADGWNRPLSDVGRVLPDFGGDARFDVYLLDFSQHFGSSADGFLVTEFCEGPDAQACGGYIVIENDYEGFHYPSLPDAVRTLFSHEYAHAVGASYLRGASTWWDEGQATWAELAYADIEHDVVRLASRWFQAPARSLDDLAGPGEGWAYAGSTFVLHLVEVHGHALIRQTWEALADGTARTAVGALDAALTQRGSSANEAWVQFGEAAWFTGTRPAPEDVTPIPFAGQLPELTVRSIEVTSLPYRHTSASWSADPLRLQGLEALSDALVLRPCEEDAPVPSVLRLDPAAGRAQSLLPGSAPFRAREEVVFTFLGSPRRSASHCVVLYDAAEAPPLCEDDSGAWTSCEDPDGGGEETPCTGDDCESSCGDAPCEPEPELPGAPEEGGGCTAAIGPTGMFIILAGLLRRRRRHAERA